MDFSYSTANPLDPVSRTTVTSWSGLDSFGQVQPEQTLPWAHFGIILASCPGASLNSVWCPWGPFQYSCLCKPKVQGTSQWEKNKSCNWEIKIKIFNLKLPTNKMSGCDCINGDILQYLRKKLYQFYLISCRKWMRNVDDNFLLFLSKGSQLPE